MLEWLKTILGDTYTEETDKRVSAEIGKGFVSKTDFNTKNEELKTTQGKLADANKAIEAFKVMDVEGIKKAADEWKAKFEQAETEHAAKLADLEFDGLVTGAITEAKGRNAKAIRALLDVEALKASKNQGTDIKAALEALKEGNGYLFEEEGGAHVDSGGPHGPSGGTDYSKMSDEEYYAATMKKE